MRRLIGEPGRHITGTPPAIRLALFAHTRATAVGVARTLGVIDTVLRQAIAIMRFSVIPALGTVARWSPDFDSGRQRGVTWAVRPAGNVYARHPGAPWPPPWPRRAQPPSGHGRRGWGSGPG